jgi:glycosyltransferase involved in cell wall biosynthesis
VRIVVNDIAANVGGAMTVLQDFYTCVCEYDRENQWIFLLNDRYFPETDNVKIYTLPDVKKSRVRKLLFDFVTGRRYINAHKPDVVLSLQNIITFGVKAPQLVYIHQSIPFQTQKRFSFIKKDERFLAVIQYFIGGIIKLSAKRSNRVIVQTNWMKDAICRQCRIPENRVVVSSPVVDRKACMQANGLFEKASFFYPTADASYKNNDCIRKASELLEQQGVDHIVTLTLPKERSGGKVVCVGRLPYRKVFEYYSTSTLVFPSYIETFGYPLAEARTVGTIILAADTSFAREVLADYENAYFFDPFQPAQLADLMGRVVSGEISVKPTEQACEPADQGWINVLNQIVSFVN